MAKPAATKRSSNVTGASRPKRKPGKASLRRPAPKAPAQRLWQRALVLGLEVAALLAAALVLIIAVLGRSANWFGGTHLAANLIPFAATVLLLALVGGWLMVFWLRGRAWLRDRAAILPVLMAMILAVAAGWFAAQDQFHHELESFRTLVGGRAAAARTTLAHQVFAAYRRSDLYQMRRVMERAEVYAAVIREAADAYDVDEEILVGVGAAESSFNPRDSKDGGRGLFQITAPPKIAVEQVKERLSIERLDMHNQRHNALVAAATLRHYLSEMGGDLFLGLLAYNIGPRNGGLRSIMQQYGARDFVTIQPYLKDLPRDYPVRVLTGALAYRLWRTEGKLPPYQEGSNAVRIQSLGVPGLDLGLGASFFPQGGAGTAG